MKHLFIGESDYAASGNAFSLALRSVGEDTKCLIARKHIFKYPEQGELIRDGEHAKEAIAWADWIWIIQSDLPAKMGGTYGSIEHTNLRRVWMNYMRGKKVALLHGGGHYRDHRDFYRDLWTPLDPLSICYEADLLGSFKREHLVVPPVNLQWFTVKPKTWQTLRFGHFPSRPTDKGSEWIVPMLKGTKDIEFITSVTNPFDQERGAVRLPWLDHLARMADCDVIVDQVKPELNGKKFGEWVSIATEAAALGKISIANSHNQDAYNATYKRFAGIHVCNTPGDLAREVQRIKELPPEELQREKDASRKWIEENHALEPTGRILKQLCQIS